MLKTNSKKARENIKKYIVSNFDCSGYDLEKVPETFEEIAACIMDIFNQEKYYTMEYIKKRGISEQKVFEEWCSGLPSILDTCYYYNRSAVDDLGMILEETEEEKNKYTEEKAEYMLTYLIYRELTKAIKH